MATNSLSLKLRGSFGETPTVAGSLTQRGVSPPRSSCRRSMPLQHRRQEVRLFPSKKRIEIPKPTSSTTTTTTTKNAARRLSNADSKARFIQHTICGLPGTRVTACAPTWPEGTDGTQTEAEAKAEAEAGRREGEGEGGYRAECQGAEEERENRGWGEGGAAEGGFWADSFFFSSSFGG